MENATIFEDLFADDLVFFAETATDLQQMLSIFNELVRQFGQEISVQKTKVVIISTKIGQEPILEPFFIIGSERIEVVREFKYLGGLITEDARMTREINVRVQRMYGAYNTYEQIFKSNLSLKRKAGLFNMVVVSNGLFGCQVWNETKHHINQLETAQTNLLRRMLKVHREDMSRGDLMKYAAARHLQIFPLEWKLIKLKLRYLGHETRVRPKRVRSLPHTMLQRGYSCDHQKLRGSSEQTYSATIAQALKVCGAHKSEWVLLAKDKKKWKLFVEGEARETFMTWWYEREKEAKETRRRRRSRVGGFAVDTDEGEEGEEDDEEEELENDNTGEQLMKDGENNYGAEGSSGGSDWSEQSEQSETELDNSDDEMDYEEPGMRWCAETERGEPMQGNNCRHLEAMQIPLQGRETGFPNEILNSLAAKAFLDFYGIAEREADGIAEEQLTGSTRSSVDFKEDDIVNDPDNRELMSGTQVTDGDGAVQRSAKYLRRRDVTRAKRQRKRQKQDKNTIEEAI